MRPPKSNTCVVAVRGAGSLFRFIRFRHSVPIMVKRNRFSSAPVPRSLVAVCITIVAVPYNVRGISVIFAISQMSLSCPENAGGWGSETAHSRGFLKSSASTLILRGRNDSVNTF